MKVLITGAGGQVGRALCDSVPAGCEVVAADRALLDLANPERIAGFLRAHRPDAVLNAAAYTAVDAAESEPERALAVNAEAVRALAAGCREVGARLVHVSTDYVFDGRQSHPYAITDVANPLGVYGASKLAGERHLLAVQGLDWCAVRTAWVYGATGRNFMLTMLRLFADRDEVPVVTDQVGSPTHARSLAGVLWQACADAKMRGLHHYTDAGVASWYDFAVAISEEARAVGLVQRNVRIRPVPTRTYPTPAARPAYAVLDKTVTWEALGRAAPHWRVELRKALQEIRTS